jgi:glucose-1-phosphate thymidylyltransferase
MKRKGIILAGGSGSRLRPLTLVTSKQLLPVYHKPMIYYPLSTLMLAGIRDILVITTPADASQFRALLADGRQWGLSIAYAEQAAPEGIAQALLIAEDFLAGDPCCLVLGDNLIYGHGLTAMLRRANAQTEGATVFAYHVEDPERYGVVAFDGSHRALSLEEKPKHPRSQWAVIGLYFYDATAPARAGRLTKSARGEYEITDLNNIYLGEEALKIEPLGRGFAWFDAGTHASLLEAAEFVRLVQRRQRQLIASPEEIALDAGWISDRDFAASVARTWSPDTRAAFAVGDYDMPAAAE